jgi:hypothetical protein
VSFSGRLLRGAAETRLVDVDPWEFDRQRTYPVAVAALAGDLIETTCTWSNPGDDYILPGPSSTDEMCNQALVGWPPSDCAF